MSPKTLIWIGASVGGFIGGYVPLMFGADSLSLSSIIGSMIGGLLGIYGGYKISQII